MNEETRSKTTYRVVEADYVISSPNLKLCPSPSLPEIAIAGRSNVGKSSLINLLCNRKNLAKTSNTPGKTQLINFFSLRIEPDAHRLHLVDLPGYGYTKTGKAVQELWGKTIGEFLEKRDALAGILQLVDCRHKPSELDLQMREWILYKGTPSVIVLTKADKLSNNELGKSKRAIIDALEIKRDEPMVITSTLKKRGIEELAQRIVELITPAP